MLNSRRLTKAFVLCMTGFVWVACGDDDSPSGGTGGSATGGFGPDASSSGGNAAQTGGSSSGGAPSGGATASGGAGGGQAGMAGSPGEAGAGGVGGEGGGAPTYGACVESCASDDDCSEASGGAGGEGGGSPALPDFVCAANRCRPKNTHPSQCSEDDDCIPVSSLGWTTDCTESVACPGANQVCVDIGGALGKCAPVPGNTLCFLNEGRRMYPRLDGSGDVEVCVTEGAACHPVEGVCVVSCTQEVECLLEPAGSKKCTTGNFCGCTANEDCASGFCNPETGLCGCDGAEDCTAPTAKGPVCIGGRCGCASIEDCTQAYPNTLLACE